MLSRNGTRQPQARNEACGSVAASAKAPVDVSMPSGNPTCTRLPYNPRRAAGACSSTTSEAPPHSPPRPMPWTMRSVMSRIGAQMPI